MPGAIAMAAVFLVTVVEMVFTKGLCGAHYTGNENHGNSPEAGRDIEKESGGDDGGIGGEGGMGRLGFGMAGQRLSRSHSVGVALQKLSGEISPSQRDAISNIWPRITETPPDDSRPTSGSSTPPLKDNRSSVSIPKIELTPLQKHKKAMLQCFLLEMGILFHSVFIGMAISVSVGSSFIVLLIAIVFHQTFEGLALGSRIAALKWKDGAIQPWLMACAYGLTTPAGQAIGLATHTLYSPDSATGLLMVGIMNAISSGLLVFAGLVELLAEDFLSDESWHILTGKRRILACLYVFLGAFGMALVGAWA
jgi:zinc transporter 1/2/3